MRSGWKALVEADQRSFQLAFQLLVTKERTHNRCYVNRTITRLVTSGQSLQADRNNVPWCQVTGGGGMMICVGKSASKM
jgi:hypothetical protein